MNSSGLTNIEKWSENQNKQEMMKNSFESFEALSCQPLFFDPNVGFLIARIITSIIKFEQQNEWARLFFLPRRHREPLRPGKWRVV